MGDETWNSKRKRAAFIWKKCWKPALTILIPLLFSPIFLWKGSKSNPACTQKCREPEGAFVILIMASYWVSECLPLSVTALIPIIFFPFLEVTGTEDITKSYLNSSVLLLLAGCIVALAFEYSNLHTRIALKVITVVGTRIDRLLLGIMVTSMFLSMWMNNTSTTAMMVPIIYVIMAEFEQPVAEESHTEVMADPQAPPEVLDPKQTDSKLDADLDQTNSTAPETPLPSNTQPEPSPAIRRRSLVTDAKKLRDIKIMFLLGVAAASNIGGTGILTGTATNVIAQSELGKKKKEVQDDKTRYENATLCGDLLDIDFMTWAAFNIVPMFITTICSWAVLYIYSAGFPRWMSFWNPRTPQEILEARAQQQVSKNIQNAIRAKYAQLGPMSLHEIFVLAHFMLLVILWTTQFAWHSYFFVGETKFPHDLTAGMFVCLLLFVIPKEKRYYKDFFRGGLGEGMKDPVLKWGFVETKVPWGPLILIGGGSAISTGITKSGLGSLIGKFLKENSNGVDPAAFLAIILLLVALMTTIASNTATASILSPVLIELAFTKNINPLYFVVVPTVAASYAFILPISTPPNAIVFDKSDMKQSEMAIPGILLTIICNLLMFACTHTYDELIFHFSSYSTPDNHAVCGPPITPR